MSKMTQEQINQKAVMDNQSHAFKTTAENCKETKLWDVVRSGSHTTIDLIAAERYDNMEWYKARAEYLEKRVAELEEKMKFLDCDGKPCDRCNEPVCYDGNEGKVSERDEAIICSECFAREKEEDKYD